MLLSTDFSFIFFQHGKSETIKENNNLPSWSTHHKLIPHGLHFVQTKILTVIKQSCYQIAVDFRFWCVTHPFWTFQIMYFYNILNTNDYSYRRKGNTHCSSNDSSRFCKRKYKYIRYLYRENIKATGTFAVVGVALVVIAFSCACLMYNKQ